MSGYRYTLSDGYRACLPKLEGAQQSMLYQMRLTGKAIGGALREINKDGSDGRTVMTVTMEAS